MVCDMLPGEVDKIRQLNDSIVRGDRSERLGLESVLKVL